jgi:hypothetical protein
LTGVKTTRGRRSWKMEENKFYLYLKERFPESPNMYLEIKIKSRTFDETIKKEREFNYCTIKYYDKEKFQIVVGLPTIDVSYDDLKDWKPTDNIKPTKTIDLYLKKALVLGTDKKLKLRSLYWDSLLLLFWRRRQP